MKQRIHSFFMLNLVKFLCKKLDILQLITQIIYLKKLDILQLITQIIY